MPRKQRPLRSNQEILQGFLNKGPQRVWTRQPGKTRVHRALIEQAVSLWWNKCLLEGRLLDHGDPGVDYVGALPWPQEVSVECLYAAYVQGVGGHLVPTMGVFMRVFRSMVDYRTVSRKVEMPLGRLKDRAPRSIMRTFVLLGHLGLDR